VSPVVCRKQLAGMLCYYCREAENGAARPGRVTSAWDMAMFAGLRSYALWFWASEGVSHASMAMAARLARRRCLGSLVVWLPGIVGLATAGCGGVDAEECLALTWGMSRSAVEDEIGELANCRSTPDGTFEYCSADDNQCGPFETDECNCLLDFDQPNQTLLRARWACFTCGEE
jgi:hypothetical protein